MAPPDIEMAVKMPKALARSAGTVKVLLIRERVEGAIRAAKTPCAARAPTSISGVVAAPPTAEASEKPMTPIMRERLRPRTSPTRPPRSSRPPKVRA